MLQAAAEVALRRKEVRMADGRYEVVRLNGYSTRGEDCMDATANSTQHNRRSSTEYWIF